MKSKPIFYFLISSQQIKRAYKIIYYHSMRIIYIRYFLKEKILFLVIDIGMRKTKTIRFLCLLFLFEYNIIETMYTVQ